MRPKTPLLRFGAAVLLFQGCAGFAVLDISGWRGDKVLPVSPQKKSFGCDSRLLAGQGFGKDKDDASASKIGGGLFGKNTPIKGSAGQSLPKTKLPATAPNKKVLEIAAAEVKVAPLRFFLQILLTGDIRNTPTEGSWLTSQGEEEGELNVYYQDGTGMISLQLKPKTIQMFRYGEQPSLPYQLQESVLLHSVLDELETVAFEESVEVSKRLLQLDDEDAISAARATLPARRED